MRVIDINQKIIVPIVDETKGGMVYEAQMTVAELFARFLPDYTPEVVEAIPVEWLEKLQTKMVRDMYSESIVGAVDVIIWEWEKEQEAQDG